MTTIKSVSTLLTILILSLTAGTAAAQNGDRLERDIRIAEGILAELFDTEENAFTLRGDNIRGISGEYISNYGVHFEIGTNINPRTVRVILRGHAQIEQEQDADPSEVASANREFVEERMMEYFKTYASLLKDIPADEVIRLTFGADSRRGSVMVFHTGSDNQQRDRVPRITAWAKVSDIQSYNNDSISDEEFERRIQFRDLTNQETDRSQEVFSSILQTAINRSSEYVRVIRNPDIEYLPGLSLKYEMVASVRTGHILGNTENIDFDFDFDVDRFESSMDSFAVGLSVLLENVGDGLMPIAAKLDSAFHPGRYEASTDSIVNHYRDSIRVATQKLRNNRNESTVSEEEMSEEVEKVHRELKQTIQEYGPTLRSLKDDEMLIVTIHWSGRHSSLPQRSELRILMSDLKNGKEPEIRKINRR